MATLHALLDTRAAEQPDDPAYTFVSDPGTEIRTWAELQRRASQVAASLLDAGLSTGDRALLAFPDGLAELEAFFGCLYAGVVAVPAHPPDPMRLDRTLPRLQAITADARPAVVLTTDSLTSALAPLGLPIVGPAAAESELLWPAPGAPGLAYLQYTSGSTAEPKGVMVHHGHLLHQLADFDTGYHHEGGVIVTWLPATHDLGRVYGRLMGLFRGIPTVFTAPASFMARPRLWLEMLSDHGGTHSPSPNFGFAIAASRVRSIEGLDLSQVRVLLNGAEPIRRESEAAFMARFGPCGLAPTAITHAMGMSESTAKIVSERIENEARFLVVDGPALAENRVVVVPSGTAGARTVASNGSPVLDTRIRIVEPKAHSDLGEERVGELWVSGTTVAAGYWERAEATAETFEATLDTGEGPWMRTGDLGFLHEGELYLVGRLKDVLIVRGQNHHAPDLEWAIQGTHPAIRPDAAAAFAVVGEEEEVVLVTEISGDPEPQAVFRALRGALSEVGISADHLGLLPPRSLPKTSSGKLKRQATRAAFLAGTLPLLHRWDRKEVDGTGERGDLRAQILGHTAALLGVVEEEIEADVPFRELGLDSVTAVELMERVGRSMGRELRASLLYDHPTVEALAQALSAPRDHEDIRAMSDAEVEAALLAELEDL